ncbi:centrosomal protein of 112 kDa-like isoform X2 [Rhopilema esculentum]|uniref:centrosomal protein of 112 kDa-like isoform X2 n=1 Tax=Rhopilema esculentum TaxID=499914 RepID=UPI0031E385A5
MSRKKEQQDKEDLPPTDLQHMKLLDEAFKSYIDDMKPFVLSLPDKSDRQRIALWIKKLCGPVGQKSSERKNRNLYAQILFQMLRKGWIDEPFDDEPAPGPLQILPAYMSRHEDATTKKKQSKTSNNRAPEWIRGELPSSDSAFFETRRLHITKEDDRSTSPESPNRSMVKFSEFADNMLDVDDTEHEGFSDPSLSDQSQETDSLEDISEDLNPQYNKRKSPRYTPPPSYVRRHIPKIQGKEESTLDRAAISQTNIQNKRSQSRSPESGMAVKADENEKLRAMLQELQGRLKSSEVKLAEERLLLQRERDMAVQKVLDRKNAEIESFQSQSKTKMNEIEENKRRLEKKIIRLTRDLNQANIRNEKEVEELKAIIKQNKVNAEHELERRVLERVADFEKEKFNMQKEHAQNIQELLDETSERLKKIEHEYLHKIDSSDIHLKELENELYQVKRSRDNYKQEKEGLESEYEELKEKLVLARGNSEDQNARVKGLEKEKKDLTERHDQVLRDLRRKTDAAIDSMKKEHSSTASKTSVVISELEGKISHLKQSLEDMELQRKRDLREQESNHKQEIVRLQVFQDKTIRNIKSEAEKTETELQNKVRILEQTVKDKGCKVVQLEAQLADQQLQSQNAIENFKNQAEENSRKTFLQMKQQINQVESNLEIALLENNALKAKYKEETDLLKAKHEKQLSEMKQRHEEEKERVLGEAETELQKHELEYKQEIEEAKSRLNGRIKDLEESLLREKERNIKVIQANSLRKQQLVELGMLRDEERQSFIRQEESLQAKFRSQLEQQKLSLQKEHSSVMEKMLGETNEKLKQIESEYALSSERNQQIITELQSQVMESNEKLSREQSNSQVRILDLTENYEQEKDEIKKHHSNVLKNLTQEVDLHRSRSRHYEKKCQKLELKSQESMTQLKLDYEEKMRGLLPGSARMELEETINALREQISLMQSRATLLQEELENRDGLAYPLDDEAKT